jgi:hypothetical protein
MAKLLNLTQHNKFKVLMQIKMLTVDLKPQAQLSDKIIL